MHDEIIQRCENGFHCLSYQIHSLVPPSDPNSSPLIESSEPPPLKNPKRTLKEALMYKKSLLCRGPKSAGLADANAQPGPFKVLRGPWKRPRQWL